MRNKENLKSNYSPLGKWADSQILGYFNISILKI